MSYADHPSRRKLKRNLNDGETPWDDWPRERLLMEVLLMADALASARNVLSIARSSEWYTCPAGHCQGPNGAGFHSATCSLPLCGLPVRPLTWDDFEDAVKPEPAPKGTRP